MKNQYIPGNLKLKNWKWRKSIIMIAHGKTHTLSMLAEIAILIHQLRNLLLQPIILLH